MWVTGWRMCKGCKYARLYPLYEEQLEGLSWIMRVSAIPMITVRVVQWLLILESEVDKRVTLTWACTRIVPQKVELNASLLRPANKMTAVSTTTHTVIYTLYKSTAIWFSLCSMWLFGHLWGVFELHSAQCDSVNQPCCILYLMAPGHSN